MKKYLVLMVVAVGISAACFAQTKEKNEKEEKDEQIIVPVAVKDAFGKQYPGTKAKWEKEDGKYEAGFKQHGHEMSALFDENGTLAETEMEIKVSELPASVLDYVKMHHKGAEVEEAAKITKANGEVNYEAEVKGEDIIFDESGKFIKTEEDD